MAAASDRYRDFVTACLAQGPMTRAQLDVPQKTLEALWAAGYVRPRTHVTGCIATQWWYLPEQLPAPTPRPRKPELWACASMSFEGVG